jgi:ABC-type lipoprotein release transport system permease subunit
VVPYLTAIEPIAGYYMTLHIGVRPGDPKTLGSHGEVGYPKIILGRDFIQTEPYSFSGTVALLILAVSLVAGCVSSLYAVLRAQKLSPIEAIGYV